MAMKRQLDTDLLNPMTLTAPIRITVTNALTGKQVCQVSLDSSTAGKELYCQVRLLVEKPSNRRGFVIMALQFDGYELSLRLSLADQRIQADSTCTVMWRDAKVSVLKVMKCFWRGEAMSDEQLLVWENVDELIVIPEQDGVRSRLNDG